MQGQYANCTALRSDDFAGDFNVDEANVDGAGEVEDEHALTRCRLCVDRV